MPDQSEEPIASRDGFADEYPFESKYVEIDGHRMHYVDEGQGETLLCVHGNPTWSFAWRNLINGLRDKYRIIAIDHIGCGFSDKPQDSYDYCLDRRITDLCHFVKELHLTHITLCAHDWGGAIGMGAASQCPELFSRFVLLNTAAFRSTQIPFRIAICRVPVLGTLALRGLNAFSRAALTMAVEKRDRITTPIRNGYLAPYDNWQNRVAVQEFVRDIPLAESHPSYETLKSVELGLTQFQDRAMLLIWGMRDWCFTPAFLEEFEQRFPNAETLRIADAGHYVFEDAHEQIVPRIDEFLGTN